MYQTMYFQLRLRCGTPGCSCTGLWAYLKVHTLGNGDIVVGLGARRVEKPEDSYMNLDSPKSGCSRSSNVYVKKTCVERSVVVVRKPVGSSVATLEAVSSYSKKSKRLKDPLRLSQWPCGHTWPWSRLKTYVALAEYIAFDLLQCSSLKLFDAANVSLSPESGPTEDLYPLSVIRVAQTGMNIYGSYGYSPEAPGLFGSTGPDARSLLLMFRKLRIAYQALAEKPKTSIEWDALVTRSLGYDPQESDKARQSFQFWLSKHRDSSRTAKIAIERRDLIRDNVPQWLEEYQDRWKDVY